MMDDDDDNMTCPVCDAEQTWAGAHVGPLATRNHFRCIYCGAMWSRTHEEESE